MLTMYSLSASHDTHVACYWLTLRNDSFKRENVNQGHKATFQFGEDLLLLQPQDVSLYQTDSIGYMHLQYFGHLAWASTT